MKKHVFPLIILWGISIVLFEGCKLETVSPVDEDAVASAVATIDGNKYTCNDITLQIGSIIPSDGGDSYTGNTVVMETTDGFTMKVNFSKENTGTRQITKINDFSAGATLTDAGGKVYNAVSGTIQVTNYVTDGMDRQVSGTFDFTGVYWVNASDSLVVDVTNGVFSNVRN